MWLGRAGDGCIGFRRPFAFRRGAVGNERRDLAFGAGGVATFLAVHATRMQRRRGALVLSRRVRFQGCVDRISGQLGPFIVALLVAGGAGFVSAAALEVFARWTGVAARLAHGAVAVLAFGTRRAIAEVALLADGTIFARRTIGAGAIVATGAHRVRAVVRARSGRGLDLDLVVLRVADGDGEGFGGVTHDLELGFVAEDADRANLGLGDVADAADERQDPFWICVSLAADIETEPHAVAF